MSFWSTMQSFAASIIGMIGTGVGYVWDEEMGRIDQPGQNGTSTDGGNAAQYVEGGGVEGENTQQENGSITNDVSGVAVRETAGSVEQPTGMGNGGNEATDNRLRLRAWGRGCGGCGISMPATRDGRRALLILGVILIVLGCIVLGITAEVNLSAAFANTGMLSLKTPLPLSLNQIFAFKNVSRYLHIHANSCLLLGLILLHSPDP
ncbi:hypothetical protein K488DRAFT_85689 [Vararia minispora EC-137]|uniref:Uncharacterized protein n=1 Tax=Vararia minispora EC-137 TaxID=1314806 RepID=A0ACB8QLT7_9AGAM|nr:hypothetical protein K488DRAFT_85689 [Vararia minispora EC-137]